MKNIIITFLLFIGIGHVFSQSKNISEKEALAFANLIEKAMGNNDASVLNYIIDLPSLTKNVKSKSREFSKVSPAFMQGFSEGMKMRNLGNQTLQATKNGSYKLLRSYNQDETQHILFRVSGDVGMNYHDISLIKVKDSIKASDIYVYATGEAISSTFANFIDLSVGGNTSSASDELKILLKLKEYQSKNNFVAAKETIEKLDYSFQNSRAVKLLYIEVCRQINNESYQKALENFATAFPNAPNIYLLMINVYYLNKQYGAAINAVNKLDSLVKGDSYLNLYRGNLFRLDGKNKEAIDSYEKGFAYDPLMPNLLANMVIAYMNANETDKAKKAIITYSQTLGFREEIVTRILNSYPSLKDK